MAVRLSPQHEKKILAQKGTTKAPKARKPKYRNKKCTYEGIKFDSLKERDRYIHLKLLERAGKITNLVLQPEFVIADEIMLYGKKRIARKYRADFAYTDENGVDVVEDVKSQATKENPLYELKRHLMKERHGVEIREV